MGRERERGERERENERALSRMRTLVQEKERGNYEASTCQQLYTRQHRIHVSYEEEDACVPRGQHMSTTLHTATHAHANTPTRLHTRDLAADFQRPLRIAGLKVRHHQIRIQLLSQLHSLSRTVSKETYCSKRDLLSKETYLSRTVSKETYYRGKRDLL